jgi:uncharacterized protein (UPF0335 family)
MIDKLLRPFIPDQLKALCEKLESQDFDARSLSRIKNVLSELELTRFERYIVRRVYKRVRRVHDMNRVMEEIIIGQTEYNISMDINEKLRHAMDNGTTNANMLMQGMGMGMWNGTAPPTTVTQARRVVARPKVSP